MESERDNHQAGLMLAEYDLRMIIKELEASRLQLTQRLQRLRDRLLQLREECEQFPESPSPRRPKLIETL